MSKSYSAVLSALSNRVLRVNETNSHETSGLSTGIMSIPTQMGTTLFEIQVVSGKKIHFDPVCTDPSRFATKVMFITWDSEKCETGQVHQNIESALGIELIKKQLRVQMHSFIKHMISATQQPYKKRMAEKHVGIKQKSAFTELVHQHA